MDFGEVVKSRPTVISKSRRLYAPHSQQSSSDKCNGEVGIS